LTARSSGAPGRWIVVPHSERSGWSAEIQALRALAVMLVVIFHLSPERLPGGYIGVDVFFVISGFLITGHILRDLTAGTFRLSAFYARRARRLLPASLLVLAVSMVGVLLVAPSTIWVQTGQQVIACALYAQNWVLAAQHVDYLNPEILPTAVQHFWSLSVEEQFYLIWPVTLLLAASGVVARRARSRTVPVMVAMTVLLLGSFAYAVEVTSESVGGAYFFSTARVWQFAAGGLLAAVVVRRAGRPPGRRVPEPVRALAGWAGFAAIAATGFMFDASTSVPGWPAVIPVAGTVAVIAAGRVPAIWSSDLLVRLRPVQWLGTVSYSLYLWHWPPIVLAPIVLGRDLRTLDKVGLLLLSLVLAALTKRYVEDRLIARRPVPAPQPADAAPPTDAAAVAVRPPDPARGLKPSPVWATAIIAGGMVVVLALGGGTWWSTEEGGRRAQTLADQALADGTDCFGADAMLPPGHCTDQPLGKVITPTPARAANEMRRLSIWQHCFVGVTCEFGPASAKVHIVLFGDSHALQWFPALQSVADRRGWRITTHLRASCPPNPTKLSGKAKRDEACTRWVRRTLKEIAGTPGVDTVIFASYNRKRWRPADKLDAYEAGVEGYRSAWQTLLDSGVGHVVAIRDTPRPATGAIDCVALSDEDGADCANDRKTAIAAAVPGWHNKLDPLEAAVRASADRRVGLMDLTDDICGVESCPAVIGNVLVYIDGNHISPTYVESLSPEFERQLMAAVTGSAKG
jgi:peptidoglycan/LPS O-acetylase OafA/YrhL